MQQNQPDNNHQKRNLTQKIAFNTIIAIVTRITGLIISLINLGFISNYLGKYNFGEYSTILAFLYFFLLFADLGLPLICLREISQKPEHERSHITSNAFTIKFFTGLLIFFLAPLVVQFFPYSDQIKWGIPLAAIGFWFMSLNQLLVIIFQKDLRMEKTSVGEISGRVVQLGITLLAMWLKLDFLVVVGAMTAGAFINFIFLFALCQKHLVISFQFDFGSWKKLLAASLPLGLANIFSLLYFKLDTLMLSLMKSPADVGIYNLPFRILESLLFFPATFIGLIMPFLSQYNFMQREKFSEISQMALNVLLIVIIPLVLGTIILSEKIVVLIGGPEYQAAGDVLKILILATGIFFIEILFSNMLIALAKQKILTLIHFGGALINFIANFIFIPRYSYYGAAFNTLFTQLLVTIMMGIVLILAKQPLPTFKNAHKYLLAASMMILPLYFLQQLNFFLLLMIAFCIYFGILWLVKGLPLKALKAMYSNTNKTENSI